MSKHSRNGHLGAVIGKSRLFAGLTALAMMAACVIPAAMPQTAHALGDTGGIYIPSSGTIGQDIAHGTEDEGVATWVGRDMYIGGKTWGDAKVDLNDTYGPTGSYAVEAEGLTLVKGKLAINQVKNSWKFTPNGETWTDYSGFRFGAVGFGAMFRPKEGSTALVVNGTNSNISSMWRNGVNGSVAAWTHGGWVGGAYNAVEGHGTSPWFKAQLNGPVTKWANEKDRHAIVEQPGFWQSGSDYWNKENPLSNVNGVNYLQYGDECLDFGESVKTQSQTLSNLKLSGQVSYGAVKEGVIDRQKYNLNGENFQKAGANDKDWSNPTEAKNRQKVYIQYGEGNKEKLITFTGDGTSSVQVFEIPASALNDDGTNGIAFSFEKIPVLATEKQANGQEYVSSYASIVVNVTGSEAVDFHNGWTFKMNGVEIGGAFNLAWDDQYNKMYDAAAKAIMWNFAQTPSLTIRGGQIKNGFGYWQKQNGSLSNPINTVRTSEPGKESQYITSDDPAAAMIGSIMVPNGSFDDHVTTNGRVWIGKDFMMNSPNVLWEIGGGKNQAYVGDEGVPTASIIDMDMERHNYGWSMQYTDEASGIAWKKVDSNGNALGGATFGVYATLQDAQNGRNALYTVTDNDNTDDDAADGSFSVNRLKWDACYYVREIDPPNADYALNGNIYRIPVLEQGKNYSTIDKVYSSNGGEIADDADKLLNNGAIVNKPVKAEIQWTKHAGSDHDAVLDGSKWQLSNGITTWDIVENNAAISGVRIFEGMTDQTGQDVVRPANTVMNLTARVDPVDEGSAVFQDVTWSSDHPDQVSVADGLVHLKAGLPYGEYATITATSVADPSKTASVRVAVNAAAGVTKLDIVYSCAVKNEQTIEVESGKSVRLKADVVPEGTSFEWSVENGNVSLDSTAARIVTVSALSSGASKVYLRAGGMETWVTIQVNDAPKYTTVYLRWDKTPYIHYWGVPESGDPDLPIGTNGDGKFESVSEISKWAQSLGNNWYAYRFPKDRGSFSFLFRNTENDYYSGLTADSGITIGGDKKADITVPGTHDAYTVNNSHVSIGAPASITAMDAADSSVAYGADSDPSGAAAAPSAASDGDAGLTVDQSANVAVQAMEAAAVPQATETWPDVNPRPGVFHLTGLENGRYTLTEIKAPNGYYISDGSHSFTFTVSGATVAWADGIQPENGMLYVSNTPTVVDWQKVDDAGASLTGSAWTVYQSDGTTAVTVVDCETNCPLNQPFWSKKDDNGSFEIKQLPVGSYVLKETTVPAGFKDARTLKLTISASGQVSFKDENNADLTDKKVSNTRSTGSVSWTKVSSESPEELLSGSEWHIVFTPESGDKEAKDITDCVKSGDGACPSGSWWQDTDKESGKFTLTGLKWGTYVLTETKAPDGYNLSTKTYTFVIDKDHLDGVKLYEQAVQTRAAGPSQTEVSGNAIPNTPGVVLPVTGGEGDTWMLVVGVALIAISMLGCAVAVHRRAE